MATASLIARALLLASSFVGLCAALRARFDLDALVAPFTACCAIISCLMFAGMLGILKIALYALYLLGFAGLAYAYGPRHKLRPPLLMLLALAAFAAFLAYRFHGTRFWTNDDVSHWGLVTRHLIRHDRFPTGVDSFVFFQSYPLGLASFIYYVLEPLVNTEAAQMVAQNLLLGLLFLPVFSLIRSKKRILYPVAVALYLMFASLSLFQVQLGADLPQSIFGIGAAAAVARYRDDWKRAAIAALPMLVAITYVKNSGLFFAQFTVMMLIYIARRGGLRGSRLRRFALGLVLLPVAAFALWELHIKLRFPAALDSKHAVSLSAYAEQFRSKDAAVIWAIAKRQLRAFYHLEKSQLLAVPLLLATTAVLLLGMRKFSPPERRRIAGAYAFAVCAYLLWYVSIFFVYVFSMPEKEALALASFSRYNGTGLVYMVGIVSIVMLCALQREGAYPIPLLRVGGAGSALCAALILLLILWPGQNSIFGVVSKRDESYPAVRGKLAALHQQYDLPDGEHYLVVSRHDEAVHGEKGLYVFYSAKYEFETKAIDLVAFNEEKEPGQYVTGTWHAFSPTERPCDYVAEHIGEWNAILILDDDPAFNADFEALMAELGADVPVYRWDAQAAA